jgi:hypothetical protein
VFLFEFRTLLYKLARNQMKSAVLNVFDLFFCGPYLEWAGVGKSSPYRGKYAGGLERILAVRTTADAYLGPGGDAVRASQSLGLPGPKSGAISETLAREEPKF